jgi:hypothetical protein
MASRIGAFLLAKSVVRVGLDDISERNAQQSFNYEVSNFSRRDKVYKQYSCFPCNPRKDMHVHFTVTSDFVPAYYMPLLQCSEK